MKVAGLSISVAVNVPLVVSTESVSVRLAVDTPLMIAASLVPAMLTVTTWDVPSAVLTVKLSVYVWPCENSSCAVVVT